MNIQVDIEHIQCFPSGKSYRYSGMYPKFNIHNGNSVRPANEDEARDIKINEMVKNYIANEIYCCDSCLVEDLLKLDILDSAFSWEEVENVYVDPRDWDEDQCREYMDDYGIEYELRKYCVPTVDQVAHEIEVLLNCEDDTDTFYLGADCDGWEVLTEATAYTAEVYVPSEGRKPVEIAMDLINSFGEQFTDDDIEQDDETWRDLIRDHSMDNPNEVYQWFRVTSWMCEKLRASGEVVLDNDYGYWWGRGCCGQGIEMDGTLQKIAARWLDYRG